MRVTSVGERWEHTHSKDGTHQAPHERELGQMEAAEVLRLGVVGGCARQLDVCRLDRRGLGRDASEEGEAHDRMHLSRYQYAYYNILTYGDFVTQFVG